MPPAIQTGWMLGNSIAETLTFKLWQGSVDWREFALPATRMFRPRRVVIEWYSKRRASGRYFEQHPEVLDLVAEHINQTCDEAEHFWSCNVGVANDGFRLKGQHVGPRASGRNDLMSFSQGSFIYSAKRTWGKSPGAQAVAERSLTRSGR
jgi:hypothetical protein